MEGEPGRIEPLFVSPGSMIVTFAGLHLRRLGGWMAVADLIALLGAAGQSATAVRQALSRLKIRGFLTPERRDGRAGYSLTEAATADLEIGDARIFRYGEASESDGWVLAIFSVPEDARVERHRLRSRLSWMGFGIVSPGVWIAPAALADRSRLQLRSQGLDGYVTWCTGHFADAVDPGKWWDLDSLRRLYSQFLNRWEADRGGENRGSRGGPEAEIFAADLLLVDSWRQFPRIDPGLPAALLPVNWQGRRAFDVFTTLRNRWSTDAQEFVAHRLNAERHA